MMTASPCLMDTLNVSSSASETVQVPGASGSRRKAVPAPRQTAGHSAWACLLEKPKAPVLGRWDKREGLTERGVKCRAVPVSVWISML